MSSKPMGFFCGANSKDGFYSLFDTLRGEDYERLIYTIKSGPGCGKSAAILKIARAFAGGITPDEHIYCSADPDSLDGAVLNDRGLIILDGTAPHATDPAFPGAEGGYITFPPLLEPTALAGKYPELRQLSLRSKAHFAQASKLIDASWKLDDSVRSKLLPLLPVAKLRQRADGVIGREIPKKGGTGRLCKRFLSGITPEGFLTLWDTVPAAAGRVYSLIDSYGFSHYMLHPIMEAALNRGYTVYACYCPKEPGRLAHLLLPQLSLAFVTSTPGAEYPGKTYRRIRIDACLPQEDFKPLRGKIRLTQKISASLMDDAVQELKAAQQIHRDMEGLYRPHIDFEALTASVEGTIKNIAGTLGAK